MKEYKDGNKAGQIGNKDKWEKRQNIRKKER